MKSAIIEGSVSSAADPTAQASHLQWRDADGVPQDLWEVQRVWADTPIVERLRVLKAARQRMAEMSAEFVTAIPSNLARTPVDTLAAELLPLLAAGRFLDQQAHKLLSTRRLGRRGLPVWLSGVDTEVRRVPFGTILVIAPANYPLFLPGVQVLQALAAGNSVVWKPGSGGGEVAQLYANVMKKAGLPEGLLRITNESIEAAKLEIANGVDKVFFTGSAKTGNALLTNLAQTLTPCVVELSGCDAVVVLPSADLPTVIKALAFGMRLNGSATCMAPRRVFLVDATEARRSRFLSELQQALSRVHTIAISATVRPQLASLVNEAEASGATVLGDVTEERIKPLLIFNVNSTMAIASADIFAPVLMVMTAHGESEILAAQQSCPFALSVSIFGDERSARRLASRMTVGSVLINDLIVASADPRISFGGRRMSGFGVTRGAEGLLEMTAVKTISARRGISTRHFEPTSETHQGLIEGLIRVTYAREWRSRLIGLRQAIASARKLKEKEEE